MGNCNTDQLKYKSSELVHSFLNTFSSISLSPEIILPTRIFSSSTLTDNIIRSFTHTIKSTSGNLISAVSDHLPQFLIFLEFFSNAPPSKYNIYIHDWKKFDEEKFIFAFNSQNWDNILVFDKENVDETIDIYLQNLNNLLEKYAPLKRLNKQERKFQQKPWITKGLQFSIKKKTQYLENI